jgi:hypothetical protein
LFGGGALWGRLLRKEKSKTKANNKQQQQNRVQGSLPPQGIKQDVAKLQGL